MAERPDLRAWVTGVARDLVDRPEAVRVEEYDDDGVTVLELAVDPEELGRVIGRQGRTAEALRVLLDVAGDRQDRSYDLEIVE
jgi:hypothetical protein